MGNEEFLSLKERTQMIELLMVVPAIYQLVYTSSGKFKFSVQPIFEGGAYSRDRSFEQIRFSLHWRALLHLRSFCKPMMWRKFPNKRLLFIYLLNRPFTPYFFFSLSSSTTFQGFSPTRPTEPLSLGISLLTYSTFPFALLHKKNEQPVICKNT